MYYDILPTADVEYVKTIEKEVRPGQYRKQEDESSRRVKESYIEEQLYNTKSIKDQSNVNGYWIHYVEYEDDPEYTLGDYVYISGKRYIIVKRDSYTDPIYNKDEIRYVELEVEVK